MLGVACFWGWLLKLSIVPIFIISATYIGIIFSIEVLSTHLFMLICRSTERRPKMRDPLQISLLLPHLPLLQLMTPQNPNLRPPLGARGARNLAPAPNKSSRGRGRSHRPWRRQRRERRGRGRRMEGIIWDIRQLCSDMCRPWQPSRSS